MAHFESDPLLQNDIYWSDTESMTGIDEAFEFAKSNPLLSSTGNFRIVDILPEPSNDEIPLKASRKSNHLYSVIDDLQLELSYSRAEVGFLVHENQHKQKQLDFIHSMIAPPNITIGNKGIFSVSAAQQTVPLTTVHTETAARQMTEEAPPPAKSLVKETSNLEPEEHFRVRTVDPCGSNAAQQVVQISQFWQSQANPLKRDKSAATTVQPEVALSGSSCPHVDQTLSHSLKSLFDTLVVSLVPSCIYKFAHFIGNNLE
jgi:hypothetical protein